MDHYHSMTDAQLAEWHQHVTKIEQLERDLAESRKATEGVQAAAELTEQTYRAEVNRRGDRIAELSLKEIHAVSSLRSTCGALVATLTALRKLINAVETFVVLYCDDDAPGPVEAALTVAREALAKYDIPFGADGPEPISTPTAPPAPLLFRTTISGTELEEALSNTRREKARVTSLVNAARAFTRALIDNLTNEEKGHFNGEIYRAWADLDEVCDAARPCTS